MRIFKALAAGLAVGVILLEALRTAVQAFAPGHNLYDLAANAGAVPLTALLGLAGAWLLAGTFAGAMATAMAGNRLAGWLAGMLLCLPAGLILMLSGLEGSVVAIASLPLVGAIAGSAIARRVVRRDAA